MPHVILGDLSASSVNMALLIARVVIGAVFLAHGINHIYGGGKIEGTGRWFHSLGMRPGILHAWMASLVEVAAGGAARAGAADARRRRRRRGRHARGVDHQPPRQRVLHLPPR